MLSIPDDSSFFGDNSYTRIIALGGVAPDTEAARILLSIFWSITDLNWDIRRNRISLSYKSKSEYYKSLKEATQDKINSLEAIKQNSSQTVVLGNLQTLSVQTFRTKQAVRALGHSYPKGFTRGIRTIAGSMIFTLFNEHSLSKLIRSMSGNGAIYGEMNNDLSSYIADQLPPFDVTIAFANEYGSLSQMSIYGLEFISDGQTMSVEDLLTEQVLQFVARDIDIMTDKGKIQLVKGQLGQHVGPSGDISDTTASSLSFTNKDSYANYLQKLGLRIRRTQF